eukprot:6211969-Pleurochrysis_carterae.AAC.1
MVNLERRQMYAVFKRHCAIAQVLVPSRGSARPGFDLCLALSDAELQKASCLPGRSLSLANSQLKQKVVGAPAGGQNGLSVLMQEHLFACLCWLSLWRSLRICAPAFVLATNCRVDGPGKKEGGGVREAPAGVVEAMGVYKAREARSKTLCEAA